MAAMARWPNGEQIRKQNTSRCALRFKYCTQLKITMDGANASHMHYIYTRYLILCAYTCCIYTHVGPPRGEARRVRITCILHETHTCKMYALLEQVLQVFIGPSQVTRSPCHSLSHSLTYTYIYIYIHTHTLIYTTLHGSLSTATRTTRSERRASGRPACAQWHNENECHRLRPVSPALAAHCPHLHLFSPLRVRKWRSPTELTTHLPI